MKKILVTGKNGDISQAFVGWLTSRDYVVDTVSLRNGEWKEKDFSTYAAVVHVAGIVPRDGVHPKDFYRINTELTKIFAQKAKKDGVSQFIYISSMAVYGIEPTMKKGEGTIYQNTVCGPVSDYGKSKWLAEQYLKELENDKFKVAFVRVPSIYGKGKTEYLDQYRHLNEKWKKVPIAFMDKYKSFIYIDNLCELIYLIINNEKDGVFCPDDGKYSTMDICSAISPQLKRSKMLGFILKTLLKNSDRVRDYYGEVCYESTLTNVFEGKYRIMSLYEAIKVAYEK